MYKIERYLKDSAYAKIGVAFVKNKEHGCGVMLVLEYIRKYNYGGNTIEKQIPTLNNVNVIAMVDKADNCLEETKNKYYAMLQDKKGLLLNIYEDVIKDDESSLDLDKIIQIFSGKQQKNKSN